MSAISEALEQGREAYACAPCATVAGGAWPVGHIATFSIENGECIQCKKEVATCALSDWNWPGRRTKLERET
jgi:hypothetical protein